MTMKPETLERCRSAFDVLSVMLDRQPSQREVSKVAPATSATVAAVWEDLIADDTDDDRCMQQVSATRRCLVCQKPFPSKWVGHRICPRCRMSDAWREGITEYSF